MRVEGRRSAGFTLIELLLVIIILAAIAGAAVATLETATGDARVRDEDTRNRLERLRTAILGPEGATTPQGFVADVGRLPLTVRELIAPATPPAGWRGPYLRTLPNPVTGALEFPDGWGNTSADGNDGWSLPAPVTSGDLPLQSLGSDRAPGQTPPGDPFAADLPAAATPLIGASDWLIPVAGKSITLELVAATDHPSVDVVLAAVYSDGGAEPIVVECAPLANQSVTAAGPNVFSVSYPAAEDTRLPIGRRTLRVQLRSGATVVAEGRRDVVLLPRGDLPTDLEVVLP